MVQDTNILKNIYQRIFKKVPGWFYLSDQLKQSIQSLLRPILDIGNFLLSVDCKLYRRKLLLYLFQLNIWL